MNILIFNGSPRRHGNTEIILEHIMRGIAETDNNTELILLAKQKISPCIGCGNCEKAGQCVLQDDMQPIYEKITAADRIVIASPIYFYNVTAQTKIFIDRCQALWSRKYILGQSNPKRDRCKGYLVSVSATSGGRIFEGASLTTRYAFDAMDFAYAGDLLFPGLDQKGAIADNPDNLEKAINFGREISQP